MAVAKGPLKRERALYSEERTRVGQLVAGRAALSELDGAAAVDRRIHLTAAQAEDVRVLVHQRRDEIGLVLADRPAELARC